MLKYKSAFGKNDIRGIYSQDITEELFYNIGLGYSIWLKEKTKKDIKNLKISVCYDARLHSPSLKQALISGLKANNVQYIEDLGLAPTPIGYYSEYAHKLDGSMIITASHNPKEYNGLKMTFNKHTLGEEEIKEVRDIVFTNWVSSPTIKDYNLSKTSIIPEYVDELAHKFGEIGKDITVVVDSANATGGIVGPDLYRKLGCKVIELYSEPDGNFPNHHPNPSVLSTLKDLSSKVIEEKADIGIAYDGDSDRIGIVDPCGRPLTGDKLLLIYAMDIIETKPIVVSEVKCSQVLYDTINKAGGKAIMCKTGHGYIKASMRENNANIGGEMSGHTFFKDTYYGFDDAIYAGARMIDIIARNKKINKNFTIDNMLTPFDNVYTSDEVRFPCPNDLKKEVLNQFEYLVSSNQNLFQDKIIDIVTLDGMRIIFDGGFALIRQSNTEPVFTLRFEGKNEKLCNQYKNIMTSKLQNIIESLKAVSID